MTGDDHTEVGVIVVEVGNDEQQLVATAANEGILSGRIELLGTLVDIGEVVELALADGLLLVAEVEDAAVELLQGHLIGRELAPVEPASVAPATDGVDGPVVEDGGTTVATAETFLVHTSLAQFLTEIDHHGIGTHAGTYDEGSPSLLRITRKELTGQTLFVVILQEVEHVGTYVINALPALCDFGCSGVTADDVAERVIESHLVVEIVETTRVDVVAVLVGIIHLGNEDDIGKLLLDLGNGIVPELHRHHLGHVATEAVDALGRPEEEDVEHLVPCVGNGVEVVARVVDVIHAIVELYRLVPVATAHPGREVVVARSLGRILMIPLEVKVVGMQFLTGKIVEIVAGREAQVLVIACPEVFGACGCHIRVVLTSHVVGHKVDDGLQSSLVCTLHEVLELLHACQFAGGQVGIDIVVVADGIDRTSHTLHHPRMPYTADAVDAVVRLCGVFDDASVPDVRSSQLTNLLEATGSEVVHQTTPIGHLVTPGLAGATVVSEESCEDLIDDDFLVHSK